MKGCCYNIQAVLFTVTLNFQVFVLGQLVSFDLLKDIIALKFILELL